MVVNGIYLDDRIMKCVDGELFWCYVMGCVFDCIVLFVVGVWIFEDLSVMCCVVVELILCECEIVV